MTAGIQHRISTREDYDRICAKLDAFIQQKKAPPYAPLGILFIASGKDGVQGEAHATQNWGKLEVDLLHVEEKSRGKGMGSALMRAIEDFAKEKGLSAIRLCTPTWEGVGFYERLGYHEMGRVPLGATLDGVRQYEVTYFKTLISES